MTECVVCDDQSLERAIELLGAGETVAVPTETVYGLAANATNPLAVKAIYAAKDRPPENPLIVHVGSTFGSIKALVARGLVAPLIESSPRRVVADRLMSVFWPGALTILLPRGPALPAEVSAGLPDVGLRMPSHPVTLKLLDRLAFPLAAPSANRSSRISPTSASHVLQELGGRIPLVLDGGQASVGVESTVVAIEEDGTLRILRPGGVSLEELSEVANALVSSQVQTTSALLLAPGMSTCHYAPSKRLLLVSFRGDGNAVASQLETIGGANRIGLLLFSVESATALRQMSGSHLEIVCVRECHDAGDGRVAAHALFEALRVLDDSPIDVIVAEFPDEERGGLWPAVVDRLRRAASAWSPQANT